VLGCDALSEAATDGDRLLLVAGSDAAVRVALCAPLCESVKDCKGVVVPLIADARVKDCMSDRLCEILAVDFRVDDPDAVCVSGADDAWLDVCVDDTV